MTPLNHAGAAAPRPVTPESDNAHLAVGASGQSREDSGDCAHPAAERKSTSTLIARLALLGIEARRLADGGWLLKNVVKDALGVVRDHDALQAIADGLQRSHRLAATHERRSAAMRARWRHWRPSAGPVAEVAQ